MRESSADRVPRGGRRSFGRHAAGCLIAAAAIVLASSGSAVSAGAAPAPATLTGDWFGAGPAFRDAGIDLRLEWSQFYQGMLEGDGSHDWQYDGKLDALLRLDLARMGLWSGLSITAEPVINYGHSVNNYGGTAIPVNAAAYFPGEQGADASDLMALYVTQKFGDLLTVNVGKLNLVEFSRATPLRGGGGVDAFWNVNLATPITGLSPPTIFGAMASLNMDPVSYTLFVFDPRDATNANPDDLFGDGVNIMASATYHAMIAGRPGFYGIKGIYSTKPGTDFNSLDQLTLPPEQRHFSQKQGSWYVGLSFQQYLYQNPANPTKGWGLFGELAFADGNPNTLQWSTYIGLGGTSLIPDRPDDRFGVAYFRYGVSNDLKQELAPVFNLQDEQGIEAFYNLAVTPWFRVTADVQFLQPAGGDFGDDIFAGLRTYVRF